MQHGTPDGSPISRMVMLDRIFGSTVEFLLHRMDGDPAALLQAVAAYILQNRLGGQQLASCSKECLLRAAAEASKPGQSQFDRCKCLAIHSKQVGEQVGQGIANRPTPGGIRDSYEVVDSCTTSRGPTDEQSTKALLEDSPSNADFSFQVGPPTTSEATAGANYIDQTETAASERPEKISHPPRVCFVLPEEHVSTSSQESPQNQPAASPLPSPSFVPKLPLKGLGMSPGKDVRISTSETRAVQSARSAPVRTPNGHHLDSPNSLRGGRSERGRPSTAAVDCERSTNLVAEGPHSEGSSPRKEKPRVKELMTPDEHIKAWLAEKKRKEVRRERHVRHRQLAEIEFIAGLRRTQQRRLHHLHEEEGKLGIAASEAEVLFKKESAQARYRSLKASP